MSEIGRLRAENAELRSLVAELTQALRDEGVIGPSWQSMDEARKAEIYAEMTRVAADMRWCEP